MMTSTYNRYIPVDLLSDFRRNGCRGCVAPRSYPAIIGKKKKRRKVNRPKEARKVTASCFSDILLSSTVSALLSAARNSSGVGSAAADGGLPLPVSAAPSRCMGQYYPGTAAAITMPPLSQR